jgi:hypothetical protein
VNGDAGVVTLVVDVGERGLRGGVGEEFGFDVASDGGIGGGGGYLDGVGGGVRGGVGGEGVAEDFVEEGLQGFVREFGGEIPDGALPERASGEGGRAVVVGKLGGGGGGGGG